MILNFKLDDRVKSLNIDEYKSIANIKNDLRTLFNIKQFNLCYNKINIIDNNCLKYYNINDNDTIDIKLVLIGGKSLGKFSIKKVLLTAFIVFISLFLIATGFVPVIRIIICMILNKLKSMIGNILICNQKYPRKSLYGFIKFFIDFMNFILLFIMLYVIIFLPVLLCVLLIKGKSIFDDPITFSKYYNVAYIASTILIVLYLFIYYFRFRLLNEILDRSRKIFGYLSITRYTILLVIEIVIRFMNKLKINPIMQMVWDKMKQFLKDTVAKFHIETNNVIISKSKVVYEDINCSKLEQNISAKTDGCNDALFKKIVAQFKLIDEKINNKIKSQTEANKNSNEYKTQYLQKLNSYFKTLDKGATVNDISKSDVPDLLSLQSYLTDRNMLLYFLNIIDPEKFKEMEKEYNESFFIAKIFGRQVDFIIGKLLKYYICNKIRLIVDTDKIITEYGDPDEILDILVSGLLTGTKVAFLLFILLIILLILGLLGVY
jgi:hypothetical protein